MTRRLAVILVVTGASLLASAVTARADVLITEPKRVVSCGDHITVGVWYQSFSGGSRQLQIEIKTITGKTVARRTVRATTNWRDYWYKPSCGRRYTVVLRHPDWHATYHVRVRG